MKKFIILLLLITSCGYRIVITESPKYTYDNYRIIKMKQYKKLGVTYYKILIKEERCEK